VSSGTVAFEVTNAVLNVRGAIADVHDGEIVIDAGTLDVDTILPWNMAGKSPANQRGKADWYRAPGRNRRN
jgi:hypothetical protein